MGTMIKTDCEFGKEYKDTISGFVGKCTGIVQHQFGCIRILLQPKIDKEGKIPEPQWLDEDQLEAIKPKQKNPGGPMPSPKKRRDHNIKN